METVFSHRRFNSSGGFEEIFAALCPDSEIPKKIKLGATTLPYHVNFGLAPHFREEFELRLLLTKVFLICFDESLNKVVQKGKMNLAVRFYDD